MLFFDINAFSLTKLYGQQQHPFLFLSVSRAGSQLKITPVTTCPGLVSASRCVTCRLICKWKNVKKNPGRILYSFLIFLSYQAQGPPPSPSLVDPSVAPRPGHSSFQVSRLSHCKLAWVMHLLINSIITCMKPLAMTVWQMETRTAFFMIRGSILSPENYLFIPPTLVGASHFGTFEGKKVKKL